MGCRDCFDLQLPVQVLAERARFVDFRYESEPVLQIVVTLTCWHGHTQGHLVCCGANDWGWCLSKIADHRDGSALAGA
jgi:hypothetical protein